MCKIYSHRMKSMLLLLLLLFGFHLQSGAQTISATSYPFVGSSAATLEDLSTGTTQLVGASSDDGGSSLVNIGFDFWFVGTRYTQFSAGANGFMRLGATITTGTTNYGNSIASNNQTPKIAPFWDDLYTGNNGSVRYKVLGTAPNRKLVVEWQNIQIPRNGGSAGAGNFQAWLFETTGVIEFVYGTGIVANAADGGSSTGFGSSASLFASVTLDAISANSTCSYTSGNDANNIAISNGTKFSFTPIVPTAVASALNFTAIGASSMTLNWTEPSPTTNTYKYVIYNSTDGVNYDYVGNVNVGTATYSATGLTPSTNYFWKVYSVSEGALSATSADGTQSTSAATTYYWVGVGSADLNTGSNWNTAADGSGSSRATADATDALIIDGDGIAAGVATTINLSANASVGVFRITNNTAVTLQSSSTTTRTLTVTGGAGNDFDITGGSSLIMNHATNAVAFAFSGTGNVGDISGSVTLGGSTSNKITTTGGTGTLVTVQSTGVVNSTAASSTGLLVGSLATLNFANGSAYNVSGYTTTNAYIPTATWGASSNVTLTDGTTGTGITTSSTSFGNFTYNSSTQTATLSAFTSSTLTIQGNLTIQSTNTGTFRALTSGTLNVLGNLNINGGTFEVASGAGTLKLAGNLTQTGGTITASGTTNLLEFNGTAVQNVTIGTMGSGTLNARVNNAAGVNLSGTLNINTDGTLTISNGNITGSGTVVYGATSKLMYNSTTGSQTSNAIEFPATNGPVGIVINNTATAPNNVVNIPFSRTLGSAGVLALTAGILDNSGNTISVTNTATNGVTGGSATAYVKGAIARDLPASLASSATYLFPVGKAGYNQMELVDPTTNAGGTVTISAEVFDANSGGSAGSSISAINTDRYWAIATTNGAANLTAANMRLYDAPGSADGIAGSVSLAGAYALVGGGNPIVTATSITSVTPGLASLLGYYVLGTRSAPALSNLAISPTGSLCDNVTRAVNVTVVPASAAITGVALDYNINGVAQTPIAMTNTSGNDWSGTIPTVTPANANVTWFVTATDANALTKSETGTGYSDEPLFGYTSSVTSDVNSYCTGGSAQLNATLLIPTTNVTLGSGSTTSTSAGTNPFYGGYGGVKSQYLIKASELTALGVTAGNITAIGIDISSPGSTLTGLGINIGNTLLTELTGNIETLSANVYSTTSFVPASGINTFNFNAPFYWDGSSNVIIGFCWSNNNSSNTASTVRINAAGFVSSNARYVDSKSSSDVCGYEGSALPSGWNGGSTTTSNRPKFIITNAPPTAMGAITWSDGSSTVGTTNPIVVSPGTTTSYTATIEALGCALTSDPKTITVNSIPSAPSAVNSAQCGAGIPTASVASTSGSVGSGTFLWYDAPTVGNLLQGAAYGTLSNYYTNDFASAVITSEVLSGNAAINTTNSNLVLTPSTATSQQGGFTIAQSGFNSNQYQIDFDLSVTSTGSSVADGFSYSFANDANATATSPAAEHGSGTKLRVCFDSYDDINTNNGKGIYIMYNAPTSGADAYSLNSPGVVAYVPYIGWIPSSASTAMNHVTITIGATGLLSVSMAGGPAITDVQLPAAFMDADKSSWKHVLSARSGGIAGGFALDNLTIQANAVVPGYTTYQSSINNPTTFYVAEVGNGGCLGARTPVAVTFNNDPLIATASPAIVNCLGQSADLSVVQTGSTNTYSLTWSASPSANSGLTVGQAGSLSGSVPVTPTAPGNYVFTITGVDGACTAIDTVNVLVKDPFNGIAPIAVADPSTLCAGSSTNLRTYFPPNQIGNGSSVTGNTSDVTLFGNRWPSFRMQLLYTVAELNAAGIYAGSITSLSVNSLELGDASTNDNYTVMMGSSSLSSLTDYVSTAGFTTVYPSATMSHIVGMNTIAFANPYTWDGASNIIIDFNYSGANDLYNATSTYTTTSSNTVVAGHSGGGGAASNTRPNLIFSVAQPTSISYSWSDGSAVVGSNDTIVVAPTSNTSYTATVTIDGCEAASNIVPITVNTIPALAPDGTSGSNSQPSGSTFLYTDGSCDLIAGISTSGTSLGMVTANVAIDATVQNVNGMPYLQRHFTITPTTNGAATVTLYALQDEFTAYNTAAGVSYPNLPTSGNNSDPNIANIRVMKYTGATPDPNGMLLTPTSINWNAAKSWWEMTLDVPSFSSFYIFGGSTIPLQLKLLSFTGINEGKRNRLDWSTAKESVGDKFTVQRGSDGRNFSDIGTVVATGKGSYSFYDENPVSGRNQYRLKLTDTKGNQSLSETVTLTVHSSGDFIVQAYPNPAKDLINVSVTGMQGANAQLMLTDVSGRIIKQFKIIGNSVTIDMHDVVNGIYLLKYFDDSHSETIKINKQ